MSTVKEKIIATGLNGLVGSKFQELFADKYEIITLGRSEADHRVDITDLTALEEVIQSEPDATTILHLAAYTDVSGAFDQTGDKSAPAYQINVVGTENLLDLAKAYGKRLIHISTAYVFDGEKEGLYSEDDTPAPIEWYGETKYLSEQAVLNSEAETVILRIDQPFRADAFLKKDVAHKVIAGIEAGTLYPQFNNHYFGPTYINDFAKVIDWALRTRPVGIWHASSGEQWTDFEFAKLINEKVGLGGEVKAGDLEAYLQTAARPYQRNTALSCEKLRRALDFELKTVEQAITELAVQYEREQNT